MTETTKRRQKFVLAVAFGAALVVLAFAIPKAKAEPGAPVCVSVASARSVYGGGAALSNVIGGGPAKAFSNAVSDALSAPHYDMPLVLAFIFPNRLVRVLGFDANGCLMASALEPLPAYDAQRIAAGLLPFADKVPIMPAKPPESATGPPAADSGI